LVEVGNSVGVDRAGQDTNGVELLLDLQPRSLGSLDDLGQPTHVFVVDRDGYFLTSHVVTSHVPARNWSDARRRALI